MALGTSKRLTLGPVLFNWPVETWRDFYYRVADEAPVDRVYIGEVVCSKRAPLFRTCLPDVVDRLRNAGKEIVFSTLAEVVSGTDRKCLESVACAGDILIEANDMSALWHLDGNPFIAGPYLNVYNEDTLEFLAGKGAVHVTLPPELPRSAIAALIEKAGELKLTLEVQVHGRMPLALSARCYHARAHGLNRDSCRYVCDRDPDGMLLRTLDGKPFLVINGVQTLSYTCLNLVQEMNALADVGVDAFRISPQSSGTVEAARIFHCCLKGQMTADEALIRLGETEFDAPFANGFHHGAEGHHWRSVATVV